MKKVLLTILLIIHCSLLGATILNVPDDYATIQLAVDAAADGDTILVQPGTYKENIRIEYKALTVGSLFLTTEFSSYIHSTIIDGDQTGRGVTIIGDSVKDTTLPVTICGFTITDGAMACGGGFWIEKALAVIRNNIIRENVANMGGGICAESSEVYLEDTVIRYNGIDGGGLAGGGMYCENSYVEMRRCDISQNAMQVVGGIICWWSDFVIEDCTIDNNIASLSDATVFIAYATEGLIINSEISSNTGGGIFAHGSNIDFYNLLVTNNTGSVNPDSEGGGIELENGLDYSFVNCTIANNVATVDNGYGGGLHVGGSVYASLSNCIFFGNSPYQISQQNGDVEIEYSDVQGGEDSILVESGTLTWGEGNIVKDPLFTNVGPFPYALLPSSPCINAGTPDTSGLHLPLTELAGNPRVLYGRIDMGAYECVNFSIDPGVSVVEGVTLYQNNPNPFRDGTEILFTVKDFSHIDDYSVSIYNTKGQLVRRFAGKSNTERTKISWEGTDRFGKQTSPGVYLYKLEYGEQAVVRKMVKLH